MSATRRGLLGGSVAMLAAPPADAALPPLGEDAKAPHRDAALLALAERFIVHERLVQAMPCDAQTDAEEAVQEAEQRRLLDYKHALVMQMGEVRATTADGIAARARCLALHNADGAHSMDAPDTTTGRLLRWLMRDATTLGGASAVTVVSPDADLLAACAAFDELERAYLSTFGNHPAGSPAETAADKERNRLAEAQAPWVERMIELRATTRDGHVARARSLALWDAELLKDGSGDVGTCLTAALVRDLTDGSTMA